MFIAFFFHFPVVWFGCWTFRALSSDAHSSLLFTIFPFGDNQHGAYVRLLSCICQFYFVMNITRNETQEAFTIQWIFLSHYHIYSYVVFFFVIHMCIYLFSVLTAKKVGRFILAVALYLWANVRLVIQYSFAELNKLNYFLQRAKNSMSKVWDHQIYIICIQYIFRFFAHHFHDSFEMQFYWLPTPKVYITILFHA